jgi:hypothetical protein
MPAVSLAHRRVVAALAASLLLVAAFSLASTSPARASHDGTQDADCPDGGGNDPVSSRGHLPLVLAGAWLALLALGSASLAVSRRLTR